MRYLIIFLVGFFLGGFYNGNLLAFGKKAKELVFEKTRSEKIVYEREEEVVRERQPKKRQVVRAVPRREEVTVRPRPKPRVQSKPKAVQRPIATREKVYTVQVASFKRMSQAKKMVNSLTNQEYDAYIAPKNPTKPDDYYRVCVGESVTLDQAQVMNRRLRSKFKDSFVYSF